jgi:hypothetical protein
MKCANFDTNASVWWQTNNSPGQWDARHFYNDFGGNVGSGWNWSYQGNQALFVSIYGNVIANGVALTSDDRLKTDEKFITDGLSSIKKLRPQIYKKSTEFQSMYNAEDGGGSLTANSNLDTSTSVVESGFIAQEIFYDAPELRHLVSVPKDADPSIWTSNIQSSSNPEEDPHGYYKYWGSKPASVNYVGLIPYMVDGMQEQQRMIEELQKQVEALRAKLEIA